MAQNSTVNSIISLGVTVGIAYAVYKWLSTQCASGSGSALLGTPICDTFAGIFMPKSTGGSVGTGSSGASAGSGGTPPSPTIPPPVPVPLTPPAPTITPVTPPPPIPLSAWQNALAVILRAAGTDSLNFDQWAYYWANPGSYSGTVPTGFGSPLSGAMITAVINAGGGDRTKNITGETFINLMQSAYQAAGLSGLPPWMGPAGPGVPAGAIGLMIPTPVDRSAWGNFPVNPLVLTWAPNSPTDVGFGLSADVIHGGTR